MQCVLCDARKVLRKDDGLGGLALLTSTVAGHRQSLWSPAFLTQKTIGSNCLIGDRYV